MNVEVEHGRELAVFWQFFPISQGPMDRGGMN